VPRSVAVTLTTQVSSGIRDPGSPSTKYRWYSTSRQPPHASLIRVELGVDPPSGRADAAGLREGVGQRVPRAEVHQRPDVRLDPVRGDRVDDLVDAEVPVGGQRLRGLHAHKALPTMDSCIARSPKGDHQPAGRQGGRMSTTPRHEVGSPPTGEARSPSTERSRRTAGAPFLVTAGSLALFAALGTSACGVGDSGREAEAGWTATFDTLPSGTVVVRNDGAGDAPPGAVGAPGASAAIQVDLRLGTSGGSGPELFGQVRDIAVDALDRIYVLDSQAKEIRVFGPDGAHVRNIGGAGGGPGEMEMPTGMELDPVGHLWVEDPGNNRYSVYDTTGNFVTSHPREMPWRGVSWDGYFDDMGHLYLLERSITPDGIDAWLVRRDRSMAVLDTFPVPSHDEETYELVQNGLTRMSAGVPFAARLVWRVAGDGTVWFGVSGHVLGGPEGQRLDRERGLTPARGHHAAPVADEEVRHLVAPVVPVHHGARRVVAHPAGAEQVGPEGLRAHGARPDLRAPAASRISSPRSTKNCIMARSSGWSR
jgi:hypothetical protein